MNYNERIEKVLNFFKKNPGYISTGLSHIKKYSKEDNEEIINIARKRFKSSLNKNSKDESKNDISTKVLNYLKKNKGVDIETISNNFDVKPSVIREVIKSLKEKGYLITENSHHLYFGDIQLGGSLDIPSTSPENTTEVTYRFGYITDEHLGSKYQRLDVVKAAFEHFKNVGIKQVFNTGNWIDGVINFNKNDIFLHNMEQQVDYFIKEYPKVDGIDIFYISGEDHEGWFTRREGINIGSYLEMKAKASGREDLHHLGFMEADVNFNSSNGNCRMRLVHPGGGSSYAVSYKPQKIVESYTSGDKPNILLVGHYHKAGYFYNRGVHVVLGGTACDQTPFMRKHNLSAHVGFWDIEISLDKNGAITKFSPTFYPYYDMDYYESWEYNW